MAAQDITKVVDGLRQAAVRKCRERLENAALRAKRLIDNGQPQAKKEDKSSEPPQYGVTSLLKRKHGL